MGHTLGKIDTSLYSSRLSSSIIWRKCQLRRTVWQFVICNLMENAGLVLLLSSGNWCSFLDFVILLYWTSSSYFSIDLCGFLNYILVVKEKSTILLNIHHSVHWLIEGNQFLHSWQNLGKICIFLGFLQCMFKRSISVTHECHWSDQFRLRNLSQISKSSFVEVCMRTKRKMIML